ncbi:hypothetical protein CQJ94_06540 [Glycomyces fuscus]|nr:hypothetical protein CQJ94_06540 [Glycomyces fuscus]
MPTRNRPYGVHHLLLWGLVVSGSLTVVLHVAVIVRLWMAGETPDLFNWLWVFNGTMFTLWGLRGLRRHYGSSSPGTDRGR